LAETKYGYLICTNTTRPPAPWAAGRDPAASKLVTWLDDSIVPGAFYVEVVWKYKPTPPGTGHPGHIHDDWDEAVGFHGTNPDDPFDLGGEAFFWLGDEKHIINKSCVVFIPKGLKHCPLEFTRVDRPIIHWSTGPKGGYQNGKDYRLIQ
jgi:hypothetical protein